MKPWAKASLLIIIAIGTGMILVIWASMPSKGSRTLSTMNGLWRRIHAYALKHNAPPSILADLPAPDSPSDNNTEDAWGREFLYSVSPDGLVTLTSYGRDGEPGGTDANRDLVEDLQMIENGVVAENWTDYSRRRERWKPHRGREMI